MGRIRKMGKFVRGNPGPVLGGLAGLAAMMGAGDGIRELVTGERERRQREFEGEMIALERRAAALRHEEETKRMAVRLNLESLATGAPDIYNQLAAGRRLPKGATWIGGARRQDILQQVAEDMAAGNFSQGTSP